MINVDFADVKTIMSKRGRALMGTGFGKGDRRALDAAEMAINSPLLDEITVDGATGILINFTAGPDVRLREINDAAALIQQAAHEDADIIFGMVTDPDLSDIVKVTVIATGFEQDEMMVGDTTSAARSSLSSFSFGQSGSMRTAAVRPVSAVSQRPTPAVAAAPARASVPPVAAMRTPAAATRAAASRISEPHLDARARPFGHEALVDESVLEIPAYLRRNTVLPAE